jgi:hypothetical protein
MTETLVAVSAPSKDPSDPPSAEELAAAKELVRQARAQGVALTGPGHIARRRFPCSRHDGPPAGDNWPHCAYWEVHRRAEHTDRMRSPAHTSRRNEFLARRWQGCSGTCLSRCVSTRPREPGFAVTLQHPDRIPVGCWPAGRSLCGWSHPAARHRRRKAVAHPSGHPGHGGPGQARRRPASRGHPGAGAPAPAPWLLCRW